MPDFFENLNSEQRENVNYFLKKLQIELGCFGLLELISDLEKLYEVRIETGMEFLE